MQCTGTAEGRVLPGVPVMIETDRFHPVRVGRYLGDYSGRFLVWAIADRERANRVCTGDRFDAYQDARAAADRMNAQPAAEGSRD